MKKNYGGSKSVIYALCSEVISGTYVHVAWFNSDWFYPTLMTMIGKQVFISGKAVWSQQYANYSITQPAVFSADIEAGMRIYPVYSKIAGMSDEYLSAKLNTALKTSVASEEIVPEYLAKKRSLKNMMQTYSDLHFPKTMEDIESSKTRLMYNDMLYFALHTELTRRESSVGSQFGIKTTALMKKIISALPYELTSDQQKVVSEMVEWAREGKRINALLCADVGLGKTICVMLMAAAFIGSGYQAIMMAPTQVLAGQHYNQAKELFEPFGISVAYVGGEKLRKSEQTRLLNSISDGSTQLIIGTHSVISDSIKYKNPAIVIADEEHRFGVMQRGALVKKASEGVHSITMSATPIPRTLANTIYGNDVQVYTINTRPNGRKPVITGCASSREKIYRFLAREISAGRQAFIVCPMIEKSDSESMENVRSVEEIYEEYSAALNPAGVTLATLTGRNTGEETAKIIEEFKTGKIDVLVATTIVEVGVDVPNASVIIISNAERFGLSQLHQLRGRVGRGSHQSYCILDSSAKDGPAAERLNALCSTNDGFLIAEADLKLRGAGDFLGTKQSGANKYISLVMANPDMYRQASEDAKELLDLGLDSCEICMRVAKEKEGTGMSATSRLKPGA